MIHSLLIINDTLFQLFSFPFFFFPSAISFLFFLFYFVTFLINLLPLKGTVLVLLEVPLYSTLPCLNCIFELRVSLCFLIHSTFVFCAYVTVGVESINKKMSKMSCRMSTSFQQFLRFQQC